MFIHSIHVIRWSADSTTSGSVEFKDDESILQVSLTEGEKLAIEKIAGQAYERQREEMRRKLAQPLYSNFLVSSNNIPEAEYTDTSDEVQF